MIGYCLVGTNNKEAAEGFYDALFELLGLKRLNISERVTLWSKAPGQPMFGIAIPFDGNAATVGNCTMAALQVDTPAIVDALHAKALELGGKDEGATGPRAGGRMYFGYFRDLDGNKLAVYCPAPKD